MTALLLALAIAQNPVSPSQVPTVTVREPRPATSWVQSVRANCGRNTLTVAGYGVASPLERAPQVLVGRRTLAGKSVARLLGDLSNRRAVYPLRILCDRDGAMTLRINEGEKQRGGGVRYRSGAAFMKGNLLVSYTGLEEADEESFWFR